MSDRQNWTSFVLALATLALVAFALWGPHPSGFGAGDAGNRPTGTRVAATGNPSERGGSADPFERQSVESASQTLSPTAEPVTPTPTLKATPETFTVPTATQEPLTVVPTVAPAAPVGDVYYGSTTHYGVQYQDSPQGCPGTPAYDTNNPYILAVGPAMYAEWPCGTVLRVTGPAGSLDIARSDACPGCSGANVDLSEAGQAIICGGVGVNCSVRIERVR